MIAVGPVGKGAAATKAQSNQLAIDARVDQMTWRRDLRPRRPISQIAAGIRRRCVELQRRQREILEIAHPCSRSGPATQSVGGVAVECINSVSASANSVRGIGRAPIDARWSVSCWQSISGTPCRAQHRNQPRQRHLRRVGLVGKHRLAEEHPAKRQTIQAADEFAPAPGLDRVSVAKRVKVAVGHRHLPCDPRAVLRIAHDARASIDHRSECRVHAHFKVASPDAFRQRARQPILVGVQHHPRIGTPPQQRLALAVPGVDTAPIGVDDALRRQIAAGRQQSVRLLQRSFDRRERRLGVEPGNHVQLEIGMPYLRASVAPRHVTPDACAAVPASPPPYGSPRRASRIHAAGASARCARLRRRSARSVHRSCPPSPSA